MDHGSTCMMEPRARSVCPASSQSPRCSYLGTITHCARQPLETSGNPEVSHIGRPRSIATICTLLHLSKNFRKAGQLLLDELRRGKDSDFENPVNALQHSTRKNTHAIERCSGVLWSGLFIGLFPSSVLDKTRWTRWHPLIHRISRSENRIDSRVTSNKQNRPLNGSAGDPWVHCDKSVLAQYGLPGPPDAPPGPFGGVPPLGGVPPFSPSLAPSPVPSLPPSLPAAADLASSISSSKS